MNISIYPMEAQSPPPSPGKPSVEYYHSNVDTSRPFSSVKEAVAIFGERILVGEIYSSTLHPCPPINYNTNNQITSSSPPMVMVDMNGNNELAEVNYNNNNQEEEEEEETETETVLQSVVVLDTLKRLESELKDTKAELKLLKDREQETEVALASLNAELHMNMSRFAQAEADAAAKALHQIVATTTTTNTSPAQAPAPAPAPDEEKEYLDIIEDMSTMRRRRKELMKRMQKNTTLAQILSLENDAFFAKTKHQFQNQIIIKKKPIIPLVRDFFFFRKKTTSFSSISNPHLLYASSQFYHS